MATLRRTKKRTGKDRRVERVSLGAICYPGVMRGFWLSAHLEGERYTLSLDAVEARDVLSRALRILDGETVRGEGESAVVARYLAADAAHNEASKALEDYFLPRAYAAKEDGKVDVVRGLLLRCPCLVTKAFLADVLREAERAGKCEHAFAGGSDDAPQDECCTKCGAQRQTELRHG